jgi:hypothetical protein
VTITCKRCAKDKHPALFCPSDVKKKTNICRQCRSDERSKRGTQDQSSFWRGSNARFFSSNIREYWAARFADPGISELRLRRKA